jgi:CspA family cold shock protein
MASGILKMWNAARGFGFIGDDKGGGDAFLHISAVHSAGIIPDDLTRGERLTFDVENSRDGRTKAIKRRSDGLKAKPK